MINFVKTTTTEITKKDSFCLPSASVSDKAKVQLGGQGPAFRMSTIVDTGKVKLGGQGPVFRK